MMMQQFFPSVWMVLLVYGVHTLITALMLICMWHLFVKMGRRGWKGLVPCYNNWVMVKALKKPQRWFWIPLVCTILVIGFSFLLSTALFVSMQTGVNFLGVFMVVLSIIMVVALVVGLVYSIKLFHALSKSFGHGGWFTAGIILLPVIFMPILAFGDSAFTEPEDPKPAVPSESDIEEEK